MFSKCSSLSDIKPLENWNASNGINFQNMFGKCPMIKDFTPLKNGIIQIEVIFNICLIEDIIKMKL